ncbi:MAG: hypothetical protein ABFC88_12840 [Thermoguttaceae bacterium]
MKFTYKFNTPRIDVDRYKDALDKHMREVVAQAVMEWLDAVLMEIPVWSGASRATFIKLGMEIGMNIPVAPATGNWAHGMFTSRMDRRGEGLSQSTGKVEYDQTKGRYVFVYGTTLPWLIWNEYHNANVERDDTLFYRVLKEGPYNFQAKGEEAFKKFAETVELPHVGPYVKSTPVKR